MAFKNTEINGQLLPYDENPQWREIFARLSSLIGAATAHSWFGYCRFVRLQSDSLELSHWTRFGSRECVSKFGAELCKAAKVSHIRIHRSGGHIPPCITVPITPRSGSETFQLRGAA